jgi:hypothetical protein
VMQLGHLFLADAIWISTVLFSANFLRDEAETAATAQIPSSDQEPLEASI